jgi:hypothetical protein
MWPSRGGYDYGYVYHYKSCEYFLKTILTVKG